jgi:hypothetical protein
MTEEESYHQKQFLRPLKTIDEQTKRIALLRAENDALRKAWLDLWNKAGCPAGTPELPPPADGQATTTGEDDGSCPECATHQCKHASGIV